MPPSVPRLNTQSDQSPTSESFSVTSAGPGHHLKPLLRVQSGGRERGLVIAADLGLALGTAEEGNHSSSGAAGLVPLCVVFGFLIITAK